MIESSSQQFSIRDTVTFDLPLPSHLRIARPEVIILKVGQSYHDIGAYCYAIRSKKPRRPGEPRGVVIDSFLKHRRKDVNQVIKFLGELKTGSGKSYFTVRIYTNWFRLFMDWADTNGFHDCLGGGNATKDAVVAFCTELREKYRRHQIGGRQHNSGIQYTIELLEAITGMDSLGPLTRKIRYKKNIEGQTEPAQLHDFSHALALNQSLFDGFCNLVLNGETFPYRLELPASLGWKENHLWVFPLRMWSLPPHSWGAEREKLTSTHWAYDFELGQLASESEITKKYTSRTRRYPPSVAHHAALRALKLAQQFLAIANHESRHWARIMLAMHALNAFMFLFIANTGCNEAVAREIETDGAVDAGVLGQHFRSIKFRAQGKPISLVTSVAFLPDLRRFMELRQWLLNNVRFPYLFFTLGPSSASPPEQIREGVLNKVYHVLLRIDPSMPPLGARKIRATVADYYQRKHDVSVTAKVLQNSPDTVLRRYDAGSTFDHHTEMSLFLGKVAEMSSRQIVEKNRVHRDNAKSLEEGGRCSNYGNPEAMAEGLPITPDCKQGQGCLFCQHRILIADEEDVRKIASAAFVMEQLILGPKHEAELSPLIRKCDDDLQKIATFDSCGEMVTRVRRDVFENGNLTVFFADKFQLFLELGVIV